MSLYTCAIASGSNGNCYYVGNEQDAVLIDVGISCREVERRMARLGLAMEKVKAIFISHEHTDHIRGMRVLANKYRIPIYISEQTWDTCKFLNSAPVYHISEETTEAIGDLLVSSFKKYHDAVDPYSFVVQDQTTKVGVFTDIGRVCDKLIVHFLDCDAVFLETNYDEELLDKGSYPYFLKNRIRNGYGHLSNAQALDLFVTHRSERLKHLFLSHLSGNNNHPDLIVNLFSPHGGETEIILADRHHETEVYQICGWSLA